MLLSGRVYTTQPTPSNPSCRIMHLAPQRNPQQPPHLSNHSELTERWDKTRWKIQLWTTFVIYYFTKKHMELLKRFLHNYAQRADKSLHFAKKKRDQNNVFTLNQTQVIWCIIPRYSIPHNLRALFTGPTSLEVFFLLGKFAIFIYFLGVLSGLGSFKASRPIYTDLVIMPDVWTINSYGSTFA